MTMPNLTEAAHKFVAEFEAKNAPAPKPEAKPEAEPKPEAKPAETPPPAPEAEAKPDEGSTPEADGGEAKPAETPETPKGGTMTPPSEKDSKATEGMTGAQKRALKVLLGGRLQDVDEDQLVQLAQLGYGHKTIAETLLARERELEEKAKGLAKLLKEIEPHKERLKKLQEEERAEEESDPIKRLEKQNAELAAKIKTFEEGTTQAREAEERKAKIADLTSRVEKTKEAHPIFARIKGNAKAEDFVRRTIYGSIAHGGLGVQEAVAEAAATLGSLIQQATENKVKGKIDQRNTAPVPGKGAPPVTAPKKLGKADLYNGNAMAAAMALFAEPK